MALFGNAPIAYSPTIFYQQELALIQSNTLVSVYLFQIGNAPVSYSKAVLGALYEKDDIDYLKELIKGKYPELAKIIKCESNWQNICNKKYGCNAGQGLAQLVPSTVKYCEQELNKIINPFNEKDNLECALFLYTTEGNWHWGTPTSDWGTWKCWNK